MRMQTFAALFLILSLPALCGPGNLSLPVGTVLAGVECRSNPNFSFALYLPEAYDGKGSWPVILCFDPGGKGRDPVRLLKPAAERYGYIVVGSNDSRNGPHDVMDRAQSVLWEEVNERFPVHPERYYAAGFSGGARAGLHLALKHKKRFAGVISCGAFIDERSVLPGSVPFSCYILAGEDDFNYFELTASAKDLKKRGATHWLQIFSGGHWWPSWKQFEKALAFFQADAMGKGWIPEDAAFLDERARARMKEGEALLRREKTLRAYRTFLQAGNVYRGRSTAAESLRRADRLEMAEALQRRLELEKRFEDMHFQLVRSGSTSELGSLLDRLERMKAGSGDEAEAAGKLLKLAWLQLQQLGYDALRRGRYREAAYCFEKGADLDEKDILAPYNAGCANARLGKKKRAVQFLRLAVDRGFSQADQMEKDPDLYNLRKYPDYRKLLEEMRSAAKSP